MQIFPLQLYCNNINLRYIFPFFSNRNFSRIFYSFSLLHRNLQICLDKMRNTLATKQLGRWKQYWSKIMILDVLWVRRRRGTKEKRARKIRLYLYNKKIIRRYETLHHVWVEVLHGKIFGISCFFGHRDSLDCSIAAWMPLFKLKKSQRDKLYRKIIHLFSLTGNYLIHEIKSTVVGALRQHHEFLELCCCVNNI